MNKPPYVILIVSIGLFIAMEEVFRIVFGPYGLSYTHPPLQTRLDILGFSVKTAEIFVIAAVLFLFGALDVFTRFTRIGIASRATVTDQQMAASFGADVQTIRDITFFIGSGFAAVAGTMVGVLNNIVEPTMGSVPSYKALAIIVLGGLGSIRGPPLRFFWVDRALGRLTSAFCWTACNCVCSDFCGLDAAAGRPDGTLAMVRSCFRRKRR